MCIDFIFVKMLHEYDIFLITGIIFLETCFPQMFCIRYFDFWKQFSPSTKRHIFHALQSKNCIFLPQMLETSFKRKTFISWSLNYSFLKYSLFDHTMNIVLMCYVKGMYSLSRVSSKGIHLNFGSIYNVFIFLLCQVYLLFYTILPVFMT